MNISVVIPTYNRADLIGQTIDSILAQDFPAAEVIVVDDGSTDTTSDVLASYGDKIKTIRTNNNGDLAARNVGLRAASSALVAFCDSDDLWRPQFLGSIVELWHHFPSLATAYGNFRIVSDGTWLAPTKFDASPCEFWKDFIEVDPKLGIFPDSTVERLLTFQPFFPSAMIVDRLAFLEAGGWDETVSRIVGTDFATALRAAEGPIGILRIPLVGIRKHRGNFSGDVMETKLGESRILESMLQQRPSLAELRSVILTSIAERRADALDAAFDRRLFEAVIDISKRLPRAQRTIRRQLKIWISYLPPYTALMIAEMLSAKR